MKTPLARAAKRVGTFIPVPTMLDFEPGATNFSTYWRISGPIGETEPARARPKPSRMDFLPNANTSSGMSRYFVLAMNSETYFVSPGTFGRRVGVGKEIHS